MASSVRALLVWLAVVLAAASFRVRPLDDSARRIEETGRGPEREAMEVAYDRAVAVMGETWNRNHPEQLVAAVRVWRVSVPP